jgi:signal transduction histidine kinase
MRTLENDANLTASPAVHFDSTPASATVAGSELPSRTKALVGLPLTGVVRAAAVISILLGLAALAGWWLNLEGLQSFWPDRPRVVPNTSLMLVLQGCALWLVLPKASGPPLRVRFRLAQMIALLAVTLAVAALAQEILGGQPAQWRLFHFGRSSFPTALSALGVGLGIMLLDARFRQVWLSEALAVITFQVGVLALIGQVFGVPELYGSLHNRTDSGMAVPTAIGFLALSVGLLCVRTERGLMAVLRSNTPGGTLARRWVFTPAGVLLAMGFVNLALQRIAGVPPGLGSWALFMTSFTFFTVAIWATADVLYRAGLERDVAQHTLEQRVLQRTAELNEANQALRLAQEDLARVNQDLEKTVQARTVHLNETIRSLETVCYNIAHDLRAPNRAIAGFAEALLANQALTFDKTARECLQRIAAAAQRSDALTLDLLAYGRLAHADLPCRRQSLADHVQSAREKLANEIAAAQASIEVADGLPELWANPTALEQVLTNLLSNAIKFVPPGTRPHITIRAEEAGNFCRVIIEDNGIGVSAEHQQKIFGVFERLHSADEYPGSGIGLAIVHKSVQRMGGRVGVYPAETNGSCFWFELPRASDITA